MGVLDFGNPAEYAIIVSRGGAAIFVPNGYRIESLFQGEFAEVEARVVNVFKVQYRLVQVRRPRDGLVLFRHENAEGWCDTIPQAFRSFRPWDSFTTNAQLSFGITYSNIQQAIAVELGPRILEAIRTRRASAGVMSLKELVLALTYLYEFNHYRPDLATEADELFGNMRYSDHQYF